MSKTLQDKTELLPEEERGWISEWSFTHKPNVTPEQKLTLKACNAKLHLIEAIEQAYMDKIVSGVEAKRRINELAGFDYATIRIVPARKRRTKQVLFSEEQKQLVLSSWKRSFNVGNSINWFVGQFMSDHPETNDVLTKRDIVKILHELPKDQLVRPRNLKTITNSLAFQLRFEFEEAKAKDPKTTAKGWSHAKAAKLRLPKNAVLHAALGRGAYANIKQSTLTTEMHQLVDPETTDPIVPCRRHHDHPENTQTNDSGIHTIEETIIPDVVSV